MYENRIVYESLKVLKTKFEILKISSGSQTDVVSCSCHLKCPKISVQPQMQFFSNFPFFLAYSLKLYHRQTKSH